MSKLKKTDEAVVPMGSSIPDSGTTMGAKASRAERPAKNGKKPPPVNEPTDENDVPIPLEKSDAVQTTIKISGKILKEVETIAEETQLTRNKVLEHLLSYAIRKHRQLQKRGG